MYVLLAVSLSSVHWALFYFTVLFLIFPTGPPKQIVTLTDHHSSDQQLNNHHSHVAKNESHNPNITVQRFFIY